MKNITYIVSFVHKSLEFEWTAEMLDKSKYNLSFILLNTDNSNIEEFLRSKNINTYRVNYAGKKDLPKAILKTYSILKKEKTSIIHAHLFDACIVGLIAAKMAGVKRRIHTRHNSMIHHDYHPHAVKYDKFINYLSTEIVAVSKIVKEILIDLENVPANKVKIIHHGFKLSEFENISQSRIDLIKQKNNVPADKQFTIGVISRYIHWKGIQYIIPAFQKLLLTYPGAHLILANAYGPYKKEIQNLLNQLPVNSYTEIRFEEDVFALYKLFDIFVHAPIDNKSEAFGQIYIETMAAGIPSIVTMSGIANDFITNKQNALLIPFKDSESIHNSILDLVNNSELKETIIKNGVNSINKMFKVETMIQNLEQLYEG